MLFFFSSRRRHTRSLCDWSSDVCSSDLSLWQGDRELKGEPMDAAQARAIYEEIVRRKRDPALIELAGHGLLRARRSEERRVGKECRSRWSPDHEKKKKKDE